MLLGLVEVGDTGGSKLFELGLLFSLLVPFEVFEAGDVELCWVDMGKMAGDFSSMGESGGAGISVPLVRDSRGASTGSSNGLVDDDGMADFGIGALTLRF